MKTTSKQSVICCFTSSTKSSDLLRSHQQQLGDGRGGGHGVAVDSVDLEGSGHAPHPLVGGQDLLITDQNPVWVFNWNKESGGKTKYERKRLKHRRKMTVFECFRQMYSFVMMMSSLSDVRRLKQRARSHLASTCLLSDALRTHLRSDHSDQAFCFPFKLVTATSPESLNKSPDL